MRSAAEWLDEYGGSHLNPLNKRLHWVCVPVIVWCLLGFLYVAVGHWAGIAVLGLALYYAFLSPPLALASLLLLAGMLWSVAALARVSSIPLWAICAVLFALAWIGQFVGHAIEGKRPSFFKDLQFLLIGPLWLLADLFRRLGYEAAEPKALRRS